MGDIVSASRRTDVPAFYTGWLLRKLAEGEVAVPNPFRKAEYRVSLRPGDVSCFVFWSKNYSPMLKHLEAVEKVTPHLYFHFTITGAPKDLEPKTPDFKEAIGDFIYLSRRFSPARLVWRFDPICITDKAPFELYREAFALMAEMLRGHCIKTYISFVKRYEKTDRNIERYSAHRLSDVSEEAMRAYGEELARVASSNGMALYACCNDFLLSGRIRKARCIHRDELSGVFGGAGVGGANAPTRKGCGCSRSLDIGTYDTCPHGCLYCYANSDREKVEKRYRASGGDLLR